MEMYAGDKQAGSAKGWGSNLLVTAACAALLGGCADSRLSQPQIRLPTAFEAPAGEPAVQPATLERWWTLFNDPQLETLTEAALISAPDARVALARVEEARALRSQRLASLWPQGNLNGSATHQETSQNGGGGFTTTGSLNTLSAQFNASWELDVFGRSRTGRRVANEDLAAARFNAEAAKRVLAGDVARSLFSARGLAIQLEDARETVRISGEVARVSGIRAERGLGTRSDAARVQADLQSAQAEIVRLDAGLRTARRSLLVLLGRGTEPLDGLPIEATIGAIPDLPPTAPSELLVRRPDVREAEARLRVAADTARLSGLALLPTFTLRPGASISRTSGAYAATTTMWSLGVGALLPVLDRPRLMAVVRGDKARGEQAVIAFERAVQTAYGEAENAMTLLEADQARIERLSSAETQARFAYDAARRGYQAGLTDINALLDAERAWRGVRSTLNAARTQTLQDAVAAFQALGGGWSPSDFQTAVADRAP
jgi:NodT family efflux transporter outer membrane factor (OMF) lipoprotein